MSQTLTRESNDGRGGRPSTRADRTRLAILQGAAAAFREHGFHATRLEDVAAALGRTKGSLYYYFASKEEILFFCQDYTLDALLAAAGRAKRDGAGAVDALRRLLADHVRVVLGEMGGGLAHLEVDALPSELRATIVAKRDRYEAAVRKLITAGQRAGDLDRGDPALLSRMVLGGVNSTVQWYRPDGPLTPDAIAEPLAERLVRGLEKR
ncbi:MAG: TetR/AcrR family transcriptional regulator [Planctomycetota bacterium]|jgi:AcrR family transcriptional regulator